MKRQLLNGFKITLKVTSGLLYFFLYNSLSSQTLEFKNYSTKDGLVTDEIFNLHQDKQGYIWVFSKYGTLKYNGTEFKPVLKNLPIKESFIYCIYEKSNARKWVANSKARIYEVRNDSAILIKGIEHISEFLRSNVSEIVKLSVDDSLNIYAITKGYTYKFIKKGSVYISIVLNKEIKIDSLRTRLIELGNDLIQINDRFKNDDFTSKDKKRLIQQYIYKKEVYKREYILSNSPKNFKKFGGNVYFCQGNFIGKLTFNKGVSLIDFGSVTLNFARDRNKHIWVGCLNDGLYELNERDSIVGHYLIGTTINDVLIDTHGGLWVSTSGLGLFHCEKLTDKYFTKTDALGVPIGFIERINDKLFIASAKGDIFAIRNNDIILLLKGKNEIPLAITKNKNDFLITYIRRVERLGLNTKLFLKSHFKLLSKNYDVFSKSEDSVIYIWRRGLVFSFKDQPSQKIDFDQKILGTELLDNTIWLGTENGVYLYKFSHKRVNEKNTDELIPENETLTRPAYLNPTQNTTVVKIEKDKFNNLWFCTQGDGLFRLQGERLTQYSIEQGLPSNIINNISFTDNNSALLSTNKGLFISRPNIEQTASIRGRALKKVNDRAKESTEDYSNWQNLYEGEVQNAVFFENKIYLACKSGLVIIDSKEDRDNANGVFFNLVSVLIDSSEANIKEFKSINYYDKSLAFKFDVITFASQKPDVKYVLKGVTIDSGLVRNPIVKFSRLTPGEYTLTAYPFLENGENLKITIPFVVKPVFWQTTTFQIICAIMSLLIVWLVVWLIVRYYKKREAVKTKNEQLIQEYKLIALKAQINPHFMSNCLSAIQHLIVDNKTERATFYVAKFGLMVRQILDFSSKPIISLAEELDLLNIYVELEQLRFKNKFTFKVFIEDGISLKDTFVPPLLLNPIVENAIWHGLLPLQHQNEKKLSVEVKKGDNNLMITVKDNGVGRSFKKTEIGNNKTGSYGIKITEQRLSNINYLYKSDKANIVYTDLNNEDNELTGTLVTIFLPLNLTPLHDE